MGMSAVQRPADPRARTLTRRTIPPDLTVESFGAVSRRTAPITNQTGYLTRCNIHSHNAVIRFSTQAGPHSQRYAKRNELARTPDSRKAPRPLPVSPSGGISDPRSHTTDDSANGPQPLAIIWRRTYPPATALRIGPRCNETTPQSGGHNRADMFSTHINRPAG